MKFVSINNKYIDIDIFNEYIIININNKNELYKLKDVFIFLNYINNIFNKKTIENIKIYLIANSKYIESIIDNKEENEQLTLF